MLTVSDNIGNALNKLKAEVRNTVEIHLRCKFNDVAHVQTELVIYCAVCERCRQ